MNALILPDIASQNTHQSLPLEWVGMCGIALPVVINGQLLTAIADAGVSSMTVRHEEFICRVFI